MKKPHKMTRRELVSTYQLNQEQIKVIEENQSLLIHNYINTYVDEGELYGAYYHRFLCRGYEYDLSRYDVQPATLKAEGCGEMPSTQEEFISMKENLRVSLKCARQALMAIRYLQNN